MISGTANNRCINVGGGNQLSFCSSSSFNSGVNSPSTSTNIQIRTYASNDNTCSNSPQVSYNLNTNCLSVSSTSSTSERCISTLTPWSNYGPGLLITTSRSQSVCQGGPTSADTWTFAPTGRCVTGQVGGNYIISACQGFAGGGSYTINYFTTNDCSGPPTRSQNVPLTGCTATPSGQFQGMHCM